MVFSSITFLFYFIPALIVLYYIAPQKLKNLVMIIGSFMFYAWGEIRFLPIMFALSIEDYICGRLMEKHRNNKSRRRLYMLISVLSNLGVLIFFKYTNFFVGNFAALFGIKDVAINIILPIGVSFNSFQSISYAIDVYRGTTHCEKSYYHYLAYTTLFPQIIAGPIVRYVTVEEDLDDHQLTMDSLSLGMRRFIIGLAKKVLIANNVGLLWSNISEGTAGEPSVLLYWLGITAYTFQIYFDFSGYSDMAIGLARVFGFTFDENFNYPYISKSITEFWRRWHITLSAWFRDYVYIPLGGNRCSKGRHLLNLLIVWALTGFWHGASWNFVLWGLYFAVILIIEKYLLARFLDRLPAFLRHVYTMFLVMVSWVIFYFEDMKALGSYLLGMFGFSKLPFANSEAVYYLLGYGIIFVLAAYFSTPSLKKIIDRTENTAKTSTMVFTSVAYMLVFWACVAYLVNSTYNPFLYFRF
ncbi:MAG: MBOAT family protein [Clostridiales bacterium]|nr:MBOAT family protein [Clostridiales bacterium]